MTISLPYLRLALALALVATAATHAQTPSTTAPAPTAAPTPVSDLILSRIVLVDKHDPAAPFVPSAGGPFVVLAPALSALNATDLNLRLAAGRGQPLDDRLLVSIAQVIEGAVRQEFPAASVVIPPQKVSNGMLHVIVSLLRVRAVTFRGNQWYSSSFLEQKLRVERGEIVRLSELDRAIRWTNNSPFRRVQVHIDPIPNTNEANLIVGVQDSLPASLVLSADTSGNDAIGSHRFSAGASYANLWGREHEVAYTFVTTEKPDVYRAQALSYRVPLPRRHTLQLSASYADVRPSFFDGLFIQKAESITADARYTVPLREGDNPVEAYALASFKESNNNLEFGGTAVTATKADIFQLTLGASAVRRDRRGAWVFGLSVTGSPGNVNSRNTDRTFGGEFDANGNMTFEGVRFGAKARYVFGSLVLQRYQALAGAFELHARATLQAASVNLLASEQLSIGGATTVRGFRENISGGDQGYVASLELLSPLVRFPWPKTITKLPHPEARGVLFFDVGDVGYSRRFFTDRRVPPLASIGAGLRVALPKRLSLTADYGHQLTQLVGVVSESGRGHVKLVLAF